jgi:hypothetical protein
MGVTPKKCATSIGIDTFTKTSVRKSVQDLETLARALFVSIRHF